MQVSKGTKQLKEIFEKIGTKFIVVIEQFEESKLVFWDHFKMAQAEEGVCSGKYRQFLKIGVVKGEARTFHKVLFSGFLLELAAADTVLSFPV